MIHWAWTLIAFVVGAVVGMFVVAYAEVSRTSDEHRKWWEDD